MIHYLLQNFPAISYMWFSRLVWFTCTPKVHAGLPNGLTGLLPQQTLRGPNEYFVPGSPSGLIRTWISYVYILSVTHTFFFFKHKKKTAWESVWEAVCRLWLWLFVVSEKTPTSSLDTWMTHSFLTAACFSVIVFHVYLIQAADDHHRSSNHFFVFLF